MEQKKVKKAVSVKGAITKMAAFCAYQERSQQEVREKLYSEYMLDSEEIEFVIAELIGQNFINEERFAKVFVGSKFRVKKWGKLKIKQALRKYQLSTYCINQGLAEITDEEYEKTILEVLKKKNKQVAEPNFLKRKQKLLQYATSKGYEMDIVLDLLDSILE
ncbi:MAG: RecX family transcriptional regulator [Raineya sp.]|jgi:regulatory protein|nr:RecX family transcriptional regulator [Raineya sp.]